MQKLLGGALLMWALWPRGLGKWLALGAGVYLVRKGLTVSQEIEPRLANSKPLVQETSEESFPASDAPAWAMGRQS